MKKGSLIYLENKMKRKNIKNSYYELKKLFRENKEKAKKLKVKCKERFEDVLEIDAASHTGVDDIREIISSLKYKPSKGKFKVFIIDEVHMLSNSAFNALLKTIEEPPGFVKFIFCTTELNKIPITIIRLTNFIH